MGSLAPAFDWRAAHTSRFLTMTISICDEEKEDMTEKSFDDRQKEAQKRRKKKKKTDRTLVASTFSDLYKLTGETLGEGSYAKVETCINIYTELEYAVKIIEKRPGFYCRSKVLKEIEIYHLCRGQQNIIQLIEFFEESERFCLVFEKIHGGPLLDHIQDRICLQRLKPVTSSEISLKPLDSSTTKESLTET